MRSRSAFAIAALSLFTMWITWRTKAMEAGSARNPSAHHPARGTTAPSFSLPALDGRSVALADYRGRNVVITFWASWCGPCRMEMPILRAFYERTHKQDADFEILAISTDTAREDAAKAAAELKIPFPVLHDTDGKISDQYGVNAIPTLFVVDKKGAVSYSTVGLNMALEVMLAQELGIKNYSPTRTPGGEH